MTGPAPTQPRTGGFWLRVERNPRRTFWVTAIVALVVGIAIGGAAAQDPQTKDDLKKAQADLASTRSELNSTKSQLSGAQSKVDSLSSDLSDAKDQIKTLSAKGEVPDLSGDTVGDAQSEVADFHWKVHVAGRQPSDEPSGTIVSQQPKEGTVIKAGRSISVVIAAPRPKAWKTIFSESGQGEKRTDEFRVPDGKVRLVYSFQGSSNDVIQLIQPGSGDEFGDLLYNEIGAKSGSTRLYDPGRYYLDVQGDSWTVSVQVFE